MGKKKEEAIFAEERKSMIVELVNNDVKTTVNNLCEQFSVSPATIRNDLRELEEAGLLKRTHGGAISNMRASYEPNTYQKEVENVLQKQEIAKYAVQFIQDGDTIALDTGTSTFELAKLLTKYNDLLIVTYDLQIAAFLEQKSNANIYIAGGIVRRDFHYTYGQKALESISDLHVDKVFLAANGVCARRGLTTPKMETSDMKEKLISLGEQNILLADSSKMDVTAFVKFADLAQIDILVTDDGIPAETAEQIRTEGVDLRIVNIGK